MSKYNGVYKNKGRFYATIVVNYDRIDLEPFGGVCSREIKGLVSGVESNT